VSGLKHPPLVRARLVHDGSEGALALGGFLGVRRLTVALTAPDGTESAPFAYDVVTRRALDASVIVAHFVTAGVRHVFLRSCPRPPLLLADGADPVDGNLWELAAGLVEPGESPREAAVRELHEELGFELPEPRLVPLGPSSYPVPALLAERHHYFEVEVDPLLRQKPLEDGSAVEANALVVTLSLEAALASCRDGAIKDAKTELGLRRLAERFA